MASSRDEADTDNAQLERCGKEVEVGQQGGSRGGGAAEGQKDRASAQSHNGTLQLPRAEAPRAEARGLRPDQPVRQSHHRARY